MNSKARARPLGGLAMLEVSTIGTAQLQLGRPSWSRGGCSGWGWVPVLVLVTVTVTVIFTVLVRAHVIGLTIGFWPEHRVPSTSKTAPWVQDRTCTSWRWT